MMMVTMSEPIHSTPKSPSHRFRFSLSGMMVAVASIALLFSLWIPTIQLEVNWITPRFDDLWVIGLLLLLEATIVNYITLAAVIARGVFKPPSADKRLRHLLILAPVIVLFALLYMTLLVVTLARLPWS
jgi:hypothetical protein